MPEKIKFLIFKNVNCTNKYKYLLRKYNYQLLKC
jgi:hypothetical protein